jgi:hypothetical protein
MKRRTFVLAGLGTAGALTAWQFAAANDEETITMVVHRRLDYLTLDPNGVRRFSHDMAALHVISKARMNIISAIRPLYTRFPLSSGENALAYKLRHGEDRIVSTYLLSSDFFLNGADEARVVQYVGLPDSRRACGNPFARSPI